jgi:hypothetical protein
MSLHTHTLPFLALLLAAAVHAAAPEPVVPPTHLQISSDPADASVMVDRKPVGSTPLTLRSLTPGEHLITLQKRGFLDAYATVDLVPDVRRALDMRLEPVTGLLLVRSTPAGAEVTANGMAVGSTPALITTLPPGTHRLRVTNPGFQPKELEVQIVDRTPQKIEVALVSDSGSVQVETEPVGAEIVLNGVSRGAAPCLIERIPEGEVTLEIRLDGYIPSRQSLKLAVGEVQQVRVALKPMPATLRVTSLPAKGRVYLDNIFQGETPMEIKDLAPGTRRVRVEYAGCDPEARDVTLTSGATTAEEFRLSANTGRMELTTQPAGVQVYIDGRKRGETVAGQDETINQSNPLAIEDLPAGEHELRLIRKGFFDKILKFTVERGRTLTQQVALTRRFVPDYEVTTAQGVYRGVIDSITADILRLETAPGVITPFQIKDIRTRRSLREDETP